MKRDEHRFALTCETAYAGVVTNVAGEDVPTGAAVSAPTGSEVTQVLRSDHDICGLLDIAQPWLPEAVPIVNPQVFLASVDRRVWMPLAVVVRRMGKTVGIAYFKERKLAGVGLGVIYADATLGGMVLSNASDRGTVLQLALQRLMQEPGIFSSRLLVPPECPELQAIEKICGAIPVDLHYCSAENHCSLTLGSSYEVFLHGLGYKIRRNFRYYRRRFEQSSNRFVPRVSLQDFACAASQLLKKSVVGADENGVKRALQIFAAVDRPLLAGLQDRNGRWLAILGGWYEQDRVMLFLQMNDDREHSDASLSLVLRAYVIETLIQSGIHGLTFWAGVGGPLRRYCAAVPTLRASLDRRSFLWSACRGLLSFFVRIFPSRIRWAADWIGNPTNTI